VRFNPYGFYVDMIAFGEFLYVPVATSTYQNVQMWRVLISNMSDGEIFSDLDVVSGPHFIVGADTKLTWTASSPFTTTPWVLEPTVPNYSNLSSPSLLFNIYPIKVQVSSLQKFYVAWQLKIKTLEIEAACL